MFFNAGFRENVNTGTSYYEQEVYGEEAPLGNREVETGTFSGIDQQLVEMFEERFNNLCRVQHKKYASYSKQLEDKGLSPNELLNEEWFANYNAFEADQNDVLRNMKGGVKQRDSPDPASSEVVLLISYHQSNYETCNQDLKSYVLCYFKNEQRFVLALLQAKSKVKSLLNNEASVTIDYEGITLLEDFKYQLILDSNENRFMDENTRNLYQRYQDHYREIEKELEEGYKESEIVSLNSFIINRTHLEMFYGNMID